MLFNKLVLCMREGLVLNPVIFKSQMKWNFIMKSVMRNPESEKQKVSSSEKERKNE